MPQQRAKINLNVISPYVKNDGNAVTQTGAMVRGRTACRFLCLSLVFDAEEQFLGVVADRDAEKLVPLRAQVVVDDLKGRRMSLNGKRGKWGKEQQLHTDKSLWRTDNYQQFP